jgi:hypothetical protein
MKKVLSIFTILGLLSMPALAAGHKQQMEEGTGAGTEQDFEQWQEEAIESEEGNQQREEQAGQAEQEEMDPGYDLYEEDVEEEEFEN